MGAERQRNKHHKTESYTRIPVTGCFSFGCMLQGFTVVI